MKRLLLLIGVLAVVSYACGGDDAHPDVTAARDAASVAAGADIYAESCAGCHGADLTGGIGPNLVTSELGHPDADFIDAVANGKGDMPALGEDLSSQEIVQVIDYVRSIQGANLTE
jgi:cytochrome c551